MIFKIDSFVNDAGSKIEKLTPMSSDDSKEVESQFVGVAHMVSDYATTEVRFPIEDAKSLDEAFDAFEDNLNKFMESLKEQMDEQANKPEIIVPSSSDVSAHTIISDY